MSDTPETKGFYVSAFDVEEWAEKCIRLEQDRDEAREEVRLLKAILDVIKKEAQ